jgi:hypothetical protein
MTWVYGTDVHSLLDLDDRDHLIPADPAPHQQDRPGEAPPRSAERALADAPT